MNVEKFLPIGSVCKIKNVDTQYIIIGYNSKVYEGEFITYDYLGGAYPEGLTSINKVCAFNHSDIVSVDFVGFKDDKYIELNKVLLGGISASDLTKPQYIFDENGTVISDGKNEFDGKYVTKNDVKINDNPFQEKTAPAVAESAKSNSNEWPIFSKFKFDENGVVVSDGSEEIKPLENNKFVFDENGVLISDGTEHLQPAGSNFVFDENGVVVSDGTASEQTNPLNEQKYKFDKNGVVISDGTEGLQPTGSNFVFDENGVVVSDGTVPEQTNPLNEQKYKFDKNGVVISDGSAVEIKNSNFKFDENGVVISDGTSTVTNQEAPEYKFDENGILVSDGINKLDYVSPKLTPEAPKYGFNENGVVVSEPVSLENNAPAESGFKFDENGIVIAEPEEENKEPSFMFDENGVVIADYSSQNNPQAETDGNVIDESQY